MWRREEGDMDDFMVGETEWMGGILPTLEGCVAVMYVRDGLNKFSNEIH